MTGQPLAGRPRATRPMTERPMTGRGQASPLHLGGCTRMRIVAWGRLRCYWQSMWGRSLRLRSRPVLSRMRGGTCAIPAMWSYCRGRLRICCRVWLHSSMGWCSTRHAQAASNALVQQPVARLVYVSCDPETLARDLNTLCHLYPTYHLCSVQPLDMFPQTVHIECIAVLEQITS